MKRWRKILLALLALVLLAQFPFIVQRFRIADRAAKIKTDNAERVVREDPEFEEFVGIIHVHSNLGGHSTGSFKEILNAARKNELDFVVMTEHVSDDFDTSAMTLSGHIGDTLFIGGHEVETVTGDRFLMLEGGPEMATDRQLGTPRFIEKYDRQGKVALIVYPEKFKSWDGRFDGVEVFSLNTNTKQQAGVVTIMTAMWSFWSYPELTLAETFRRPDDNLRRFDSVAEQRNVSMFAGIDAHSNIGLHVLGDDTGKKLFNVKIDPYECIFRVVRAHILTERGTRISKESVLNAIRLGRMFVGFDIAGDSSGFSFVAESAAKRYQMGSEPRLTAGMKFVSHSPIPARFVLFRNGTKIHETGSQSEMVFEPTEPGVYRVELYRSELGSSFESMPWILSNPIYVR